MGDSEMGLGGGGVAGVGPPRRASRGLIATCKHQAMSNGLYSSIATTCETVNRFSTRIWLPNRQRCVVEGFTALRYAEEP